MKNSFYFQHDSNAANDQKILKLRARFNNAEGYGIYFMLLEAMSQTSDGYLDLDCMAELSLSYSLAIEQLKNIVNYCVEINLFSQGEKGIFSHRMIEHLKFRDERSKSGKRGAKSRWKNGSAIGSANAKERKGYIKEEKEKTQIKNEQTFHGKKLKDMSEEEWVEAVFQSGGKL